MGTLYDAFNAFERRARRGEFDTSQKVEPAPKKNEPAPAKVEPVPAKTEPVPAPAIIEAAPPKSAPEPQAIASAPPISVPEPQVSAAAPAKIEPEPQVSTAAPAVSVPAPARVEPLNPELDQVIQQFARELGSELIATVVAGADGISIGGTANDANFNSTVAAASISLIMKLADKASSAVGMGKVDDNLTSTDKAYVISRFVGDGSYFWSVTVLRSATLGFVRMVMKEFGDKIWKTIPH